MNNFITQLKSLAALALIVISSGCGGGASSGTSANTSSIVNTWGGTWRNAQGTATFSSDNTYALSIGGCTFTGGTYSQSGNTVTLATGSTKVSGPPGTAALFCYLDPNFVVYGFTYTISGNKLTYLDTLGSTYTAYPLTGTWSSTSTAEAYTFNANGTYVLSRPSSGGIGTCDYSGGTYKATGENLTLLTAPTTGTPSASTISCPVTGVAALAGVTSTISINSDTSLTITTGNSSIYYTRQIMSTSTSALALFAGNMNVAGSANGTGATASFNQPSCITTDNAGNVYVADNGNHTIRKITPTGVVSTLAGTALTVGHTDATGAAASFNQPYGVATDSTGNVYVGDSGNNTIRKITPSGVVSTLAGTALTVGHADATGAAASFSQPLGVATDNAGNVYVADYGNNTIRKITPSGVVSTLAGTAGVTGHADGTGTAATFNGPVGVATDNAGNVYVADYGNNTIRKITSTGVVSTFAGTALTAGHTDATGSAASFDHPSGVTTDSAGNLYVADCWNAIIRKITPAGVVSTIVGVAGNASFNAGALPGSIGYPVDVAVHGSSLFIVMDNGVAVVQNLP